MDIMTALFSQEYATEQYGMLREQKGRNEGRNEMGKEIVKQMLHLNMDMATICQVTGFSEAEVKAIEDGIPHPPLTRHPLPTGEG